MNSPRITYIPRPDATPETELSVLANAYAYLIKTHDSKKCAEHAQPRTGEGEFDTKERGQNDIERNATHGAESDRTERKGNDKHGFIHR
jgi:hypothetical protein